MYKNDSDMIKLLSKKQVMDEYGLGRYLLDKAMRNKEISYIKLERRVLFIEEFLVKNTVKAVSLTERQLKEYEKRAKK